MRTKRTPIDPVCRMTLDLSRADRIDMLEYQGRRVYFCSPSCLEKFKAAPEQFGFGQRRSFWRRYLDRLQKAAASRQPVRCG